MIVIDPAARTLLIRCRPYAGASVLWIPPGGGLDEGETDLQAARRELHEELGVDPGDLGAWRCWREHTWWDGARDSWVRQRERYFVWFPDPEMVETLRAAQGALDPGCDAAEWWGAHEFEGADVMFVPRELPWLVRSAVAGTLPNKPFDIDV